MGTGLEKSTVSKILGAMMAEEKISTDLKGQVFLR
jgi:hypothetical protein